LLIRRDTFLVLNLGLDVVDSVRRLDIQGNGLTSQGLDENLCLRKSWYKMYVSHLWISITSWSSQINTPRDSKS
jgi:hypothetical protein